MRARCVGFVTGPAEDTPVRPGMREPPGGVWLAGGALAAGVPLGGALAGGALAAGALLGGALAAGVLARGAFVAWPLAGAAGA